VSGGLESAPVAVAKRAGAGTANAHSSIAWPFRPRFSNPLNRSSWPNERTNFRLEVRHYFGEHDSSGTDGLRPLSGKINDFTG
jgi:hypothetical protein